MAPVVRVRDREYRPWTQNDIASASTISGRSPPARFERVHGIGLRTGRGRSSQVRQAGLVHDGGQVKATIVVHQASPG